MYLTVNPYLFSAAPQRPDEEPHDSALEGPQGTRGHRRGRGPRHSVPPPPALDPLVRSRWSHQFVPGHLGLSRANIRYVKPE